MTIFAKSLRSISACAGWPAGAFQPARRGESISACAGASLLDRIAVYRGDVHLRVCGGQPDSDTDFRHGATPSPRVRGPARQHQRGPGLCCHPRV